MQKKNVLTMALSVSLVGVIAVGGTLAYLTANTNKLTNTFEFTNNGITLELAETAQKADGINYYGYNINGIGEAGSVTINSENYNAVNNKGISYTDIVPGAVISKQPVLTVPGGTVNCYVYAVVDGVTELQSADYYADFNLADTDADSAGAFWVKVTHDDVTYTNLAGKTVLRYNKIITTSENDQNLDELFTKITVKSDASEEDLADLVNPDKGIKIVGYSIQSDTFTQVTDADTEALKYFNTQVTY